MYFTRTVNLIKHFKKMVNMFIILLKNINCTSCEVWIIRLLETRIIFLFISNSCSSHCRLNSQFTSDILHQLPGFKFSNKFSFVSKVVTTVGLLAICLECLDITAEFIVNINKPRKRRHCATVLRNNGSSVGTVKRASWLHAVSYLRMPGD
jgi:hypothetical protein